MNPHLKLIFSVSLVAAFSCCGHADEEVEQPIFSSEESNIQESPTETILAIEPLIVEALLEEQISHLAVDLSHLPAALYQQAAPAFLTLKIEYTPESPSYYFGYEFLDWLLGVRFWGKPAQAEPRRTEISAFFVSQDGYLLTSSHVLEGAVDISAKTADGKEFPVTNIGADERTNLALLKIEGEGFSYLPFGNSSYLTLGERVIAIDHNLDLVPSMTMGVISHVGSAYLEPIQPEDFIQIEAPAFSSLFGGPLLNLQGEVVGINVGNSGLVLPINMAAHVMETLLGH